MNLRRTLITWGWLLPVAATWAAYEPAKLPDGSKRWAVSLNLREEYDDNIFTTKTNTTASFKSMVEPQVLVNLPSEQTFAGLRYAYRMTYYEHRPGGDSIDQNHSVDLLFSHTFTPRLAVDLRDNLRRGLEPDLVEPGLGNPVVLRQRGDYLYNSLHGTLSYNLSRRWTTSLSGGWEVWDYDVTAVASNNNRNAYSSTLAFLYAVDPRTTAGVNYGYSRVDYEHSDVDNRRNSDSHSGFVTLIRRFTPKFSAKIDGGGEWREFGNGDSQIGPLVDASATYNYAPRSSATGGAQYSIRSTETGGYRSSDTLSIFGRVNHSLTPKLSVRGNVVYAIDSFDNPADSTLPTNVHQYDLGLGLGLGYEFTHWCSGEASYTFDRVVSDNATLVGPGFDRNRVSLGLRLTY